MDQRRANRGNNKTVETFNLRSGHFPTNLTNKFLLHLNRRSLQGGTGREKAPQSNSDMKKAVAIFFVFLLLCLSQVRQRMSLRFAGT